MLFKLFNWLLKKVPYTLAVAIPNTFWAIASAAFGFFIIFVKADFGTTGTGEIFAYTISSFVAITALLVFLEFGILRLFGIKRWEKKEVKVINDNVLGGSIRSDISDNILLQVHNSFEKMHKWLVHRNIQYTSMVVIVCVLVEWLASNQTKNVPIILAGGVIAICMSFICTVPLYELLFFSARRECKMLLAERGKHFKEPSFLSLKIKSKFFIILTSLALIIILMFVPSLNLALVIFFFLTLFIINILSKLVFETIYKAFIEIKESARSLELGKKTSFFSGSLDEEVIGLSKSLNVAANEIYNIRNALEVQVKARTEALEEEKASLERKVEERTKELQERIGDLEKFHKITVGRELKMIKLKEEIEKLKGKTKKQWKIK